MTPAAVQLPIDTRPAQQVGPLTYRKRIMRVGTIPYQGGTVTYTRADLARRVENFRRGALKQVPFVLVDGENRHTNDPERYRGEVRAMELVADGDAIDALVDLTEAGAELIGANPRLEVSARDVTDDESIPFLPAIQHVAGTFHGRLGDLGDWTPAAELAGVYSAGQVIDLSASTYMPDETFTPEQIAEALRVLGIPAPPGPAGSGTSTSNEAGSTTGSGEQPAEQANGSPDRSLLSRFFGRNPQGQAEAQPSGEPAELSEDDMTALTALLSEAGTTAVEDGRVPVATLAAADREAADLARAEATAARADAATASQALADQTIAAERTRRIDAGVPTAIVDLAAPFLTGRPATVEFAGTGQVDAGQTIRQILDAVEGIVELAGPLTGSYGSDDDERTRAQKMAERI